MFCSSNKCTEVYHMYPTPDLSHLGLADYDQIYEPAEDSFLFLDALQAEEQFLKTIKPAICLEVGSGSGVISTFLASMLGNNTYYLCTDINPVAAEVTKKTAFVNKVLIEPIVTDLCNGLFPRIENQVDVLLFNPPYVVTPSEEIHNGGLAASWAGGKRGREVMDRLFPLVSRLLSPQGVFYLVIIKENNQDEIEILLQKQGFHMKVVLTRRSGPEFLSILKFTR